MIGMNYLQLIAQEIDDTANHSTLSLNCLSFDYQNFRHFFVGGTHEVLPFLSPILKQLGPRPQDTADWCLACNTFRNETVLARRTTSAETNYLSKNNGKRQMGQKSKRLLSHFEQNSFLRRLFLPHSQNSASQRTTTTKAMIPPTKRLGPASPNLPKNRPGIK